MTSLLSEALPWRGAGGVSRRVDGKGAFSTNVSWEGGGGTKFYRRERPELRMDAKGNPAVIYSGIEYGMDHPQKQYSFSIVQRARGGDVVVVGGHE